MKLKTKIILAFVGLFLLPNLLFASLAPLSTSSKAKALIMKVSKGKVKITKQFASVGNLDGFVVGAPDGKGQKTIVYADKGGKYMIAGALISPTGQNLTQNDFNKYVASAVAPKAYSAAKDAAWFSIGNPKAPHQAYMIIEPNCIACHMMYKELAPMVKAGKLNLRLIFVAFLKPSSQGKAAAILQAKDPAKALALDEAGFNVKTEEGAITEAKNITAETKAKLGKNMAFMTKFGFIGTPVMLYKTTSGAEKVIRGFAPGSALKAAVKEMSPAS